MTDTTVAAKSKDVVTELKSLLTRILGVDVEGPPEGDENRRCGWDYVGDNLFHRHLYEYDTSRGRVRVSRVSTTAEDFKRLDADPEWLFVCALGAFVSGPRIFKSLRSKRVQVSLYQQRKDAWEAKLHQANRRRTWAGLYGCPNQCVGGWVQLPTTRSPCSYCRGATKLSRAASVNPG
jgi:hypothetical protein